jgi:hypothetical protein
MKQNPRKSTSSTDATGGLVVQSDDGAVRFQLRSTRSGLWVQRERRTVPQRARLVQSVVFTDPIGFARWCEADSVRFDYPIVFSTLRRAGSALLEAYECAKPSESSRSQS